MLSVLRVVYVMRRGGVVMCCYQVRTKFLNIIRREFRLQRVNDLRTMFGTYSEMQTKPISRICELHAVMKVRTDGM
jgi:hypothetical protein